MTLVHLCEICLSDLVRKSLLIIFSFIDNKSTDMYYNLSQQKCVKRKNVYFPEKVGLHQ